ncbi:MAG TPA: hypothetical protein VL173_10500 [Vicinamibacterales bacterium]|nr:hypothetical protein [Vicinamibacterales bacterium]
MYGRFVVAAILSALMVTVPVAAQWKTPRAPGTVRSEIDADAPPPQTADGHPDLSGLWYPSGGDYSDFYFPGVPMTDEAMALRKRRRDRFERDFPKSHCLPMGIVNQHGSSGPVKFIQVPSELVMLVEQNNERREIFTDGRALPGPNAQPTWNGYSVGRWDDETLLVTTTGFRDGQWLDTTGVPLTDGASITERFRRPSLGRMEVAIAIDDPKTFLRPAHLLARYRLAPDDELIESICQENNKFGPEFGTDKP